MLLILESPFTTSMEEREVLFFYFVPDTTLDLCIIFILPLSHKAMLQEAKIQLYSFQSITQNKLHSIAINTDSQVLELSR
jgi:hypothetical protein